jgi:hypothetical protein
LGDYWWRKRGTVDYERGFSECRFLKILSPHDYLHGARNGLFIGILCTIHHGYSRYHPFEEFNAYL